MRPGEFEDLKSEGFKFHGLGLDVLAKESACTET